MTNRLLLLNGLAVIGVLLHHASGYGFRAMFLWTNRYLPVEVPNYDQVGSLPFYIIVLIQQLDAFTLPAFMFVSGYFAAFMSRGSATTWRWAAVMARIRKLLVPFAVWTALFFLLLVRRLPSTVDEILSRYYYVLLLSQFYLLAPLVLRVARTRWKLLLFILAILEIATNSVDYVRAVGIDVPESIVLLTPKWLVPNLLFWFALGIVAGLRPQPFQAWLARHQHRLLVAAAVLIPVMLIEYLVVASISPRTWLGPYFGGISRNFYAAAFILAFLGSKRLEQPGVPLSAPLSKLGTRSLGVYLAHAPFMYVAAVFMHRATPWLLGQQLLYQTVLIAVGLAGPLLLMAAVSKTPTRRFYHYAFG